MPIELVSETQPPPKFEPGANSAQYERFFLLVDNAGDPWVVDIESATTRRVFITKPAS